MNDEKRDISATTDGQPPRPGFEDASAPAPVNPRTGQHEAYWVLSEDERAKGFVRPVRRSYRHVGRGPCCAKPRDLGKPLPPKRVTWVCLDDPDHDGECTSWMPVTAADLDRAQRTRMVGGCDTVTSMGLAIAETYARDPKYYGATFCVGCRAHLPVGASGEFVWVGDQREAIYGADGKPSRVGT